MCGNSFPVSEFDFALGPCASKAQYKTEILKRVEK